MVSRLHWIFALEPALRAGIGAAGLSLLILLVLVLLGKAGL